jgi:YhcG PDDEXK nuclease domain
MDLCVRRYDNKFKPKDDNPTFGIIICSHNDQAEVKYALLNDRNLIFYALYQLVMPANEELVRIVTSEIRHIRSENQHMEKDIQYRNNNKNRN